MYADNWLPIQHIIGDICHSLQQTIIAVDTWFDKDQKRRAYQSSHHGWSIDEILKHIGLTNHFLLVLIDEGTSKALQNMHKPDLLTGRRHILQMEKNETEFIASLCVKDWFHLN